MEAVGTMVINMTKTEEGIWRRLATDDKLVSVWWEARSKYPRDMDDYFELLENERIEREEEEEENHKKNKKVVFLFKLIVVINKYRNLKRRKNKDIQVKIRMMIRKNRNYEGFNSIIF